MKGKCIFIGYRYLNIDGKRISARQALLDLGIYTEKELWYYVMKLTVDDCVKIDFDYDTSRDNNSEIYVFKKWIHGIRVYIKLTINNKRIICISFHKDISKRKNYEK